MCPLVCGIVNSVPINEPRQNLDWSVWHSDIASGKSSSINSHVLRIVLWLASLPYGASVWLRNIFFTTKIFRIKKVAVPVVCIGNLTAGGTGKTPCVEWLCRVLCSLELRVAILSRGYGGAGGANDEAMVLEDRLPDVPHLQGPDRYLIAQSAIEELESEVDKRDFGQWLHRLMEHFELAMQAAPQADADRQRALLQVAADAATQALGLDADEFLPFAAAWRTMGEGYLAWRAQHVAAGWVFDQAEAPMERAGSR